VKPQRAPGGAADREVERKRRANQRVIGVLGAESAHLALVQQLL